ncbi:hypothetical protein ACOMHN_052057 [Nucella lapillus]
MASSSSSDSDSDFDLDFLIANAPDDNLELPGGSDISISDVSSVHSSDLSDLEDDDFDFPDAWSDTVENVRRRVFKGRSEIGPTFSLPLDAKPIDYFIKVMPEELFQQMAVETNRYADQRNARSFTRTTSEEMRAFLAIHLYMGVIKLPSYRLYWSTREDLHQRSITKVMSKNRYEELVVNFHLNDSTQNPPRGHPDHNKLYKVMPIISHAKRTFPTLYKPHQNLAVDEAMIKFKGRCSFLQYVPAKPHKWGIKAWALCDSESYYMLDFDVYTGKDMQAPIQQTPLGQRVVETLVQPYYRQYHHVYFDNYFTSVPLVENLLRNETYSCGTIRTNRKGLPQEIKTVKFRQSGQMMKKQKGGMHVVAWCEKKRKVCVLSTANNIDNTEITRPGKRGQPAQTYPKPVAIQQYTDHFNAVDKNDQMRSYYGIANKARKFWKYIFWFIVDVSMINAFVLYKEARGGPRPKPMTHLEFHLEVARELVRNYTSRKRQASFPASSPLAPKEPRPRHEISNIKTKHGKRLCVVCKQRGVTKSSGKKKQTVFECPICNVALCKDFCFQHYHNYI